jgi:hypothetical protein
MAQLSKQHLRYDSYKNFKFRVKFGTGAKYVAGVKCAQPHHRIGSR